MVDTITQRRAKPIVIYGLILLLGACTAAPKLSPSEEVARVKTLITRVKSYHVSSTVAGEELQLAEKKLVRAEEAIEKGDNIEALQFTEQAMSDAEYAKAKVDEATYRKLVKRREKNLKHYQETK